MCFLLQEEGCSGIRRNAFNIVPIYSIPIKEEKAADIYNLVSHYVPKEHQSFYQEIPRVLEESDSCDDIM